MTLYPSIEKALLVGIEDCFLNGYYADKIVERQIKLHKKWGARDRKSFAFTFYEIVRWWKSLLNQVDIDYETLEITDANIYNIASDVLNTFLEEKEFSSNDPSTQASMPKWMYSLFEENYPDMAKSLVSKLNQPNFLYLRLNTLKATKKELLDTLKLSEVLAFASDDLENCFYLKERKNVFITEAFKKGYFQVQDKGSQHIALFLQVEPKMRVIDACAGAGGKTLHLASLMKNKGKILAYDILEYKLRELKKRAARDGVDIVETKVIAPKVIKRQKENADRLLLDVPCSGLGVLRRNPDTKWKLDPDRITELIAIQKDILQNYSQVVKVGGKMVYATCSILKSENEMQIEMFLKNNSNWKLEEEKTILPTDLNCDGFYMARLIKESSN